MASHYLLNCQANLDSSFKNLKSGTEVSISAQIICLKSVCDLLNFGRFAIKKFTYHSRVETFLKPQE